MQYINDASRHQLDTYRHKKLTCFQHQEIWIFFDIKTQAASIIIYKLVSFLNMKMAFRIIQRDMVFSFCYGFCEDKTFRTQKLHLEEIGLCGLTLLVSFVYICNVNYITVTKFSRTVNSL